MPRTQPLPGATAARRLLAPLVLAGAAALFAPGCQQDEIQHYQAPKSEAVAPATTAGEHGPVRLLAAILHHADRTWFFKMTGPPPEVTAQEGAFKNFIQSLQFTDKGDKPVTWTVPEGWKEEGGTSMRYATLHAGDKGDVELSVTALGAEAGTLLDNVNRWRGQISLPKIGAADLSKVIKEEDVHGTKVTLVDMTGTASGKGPPGMPPFAGGAKPLHPPVEAEDAPKFTYTVPAGWKEEPPNQVRLASFRVGPPGEDAEVAVTRFPGEVGGMLMNVNRWRGQVGLQPITDDQLGKEVQRFDVAGTPGYSVDLSGPGTDGRGPRQLLAVGVMRGEQTWFFKMTGPTAVVGKQKAAFEEFVKSVKFGAGPGGNHG